MIEVPGRIPEAARPGGTDPYRVMVVDDSAVIRGLLSRALEGDPELRVVASVADGQMAINTLKRQDVDVIVLDIEMPVMDGLTALPKLIEVDPSVRIIMASTLTQRGAEISLRAMQAGASDYVAKPSSTRELNAAEAFKRELVDKVKALAAAARRSGRQPRPGTARGPAAAALPPPGRPRTHGTIALRPMPQPFHPEVIAIGSSTGGPQALFEVLGHLRGGLAQPIFVTQHMPATFTTILAEHITRQCGIPCAEARNGEPVTGGRVYLAPGDFHMMVTAQGGANVVMLTKDPPENFCRPSVEPMLRSLVRVYGRQVLAVILTGMGQDGAKACAEVVEAGGAVIAQDEATSVVWGMPGAVAQAGLCSAVLPLRDIGPFIRKTALRTAA